MLFRFQTWLKRAKKNAVTTGHRRFWWLRGADVTLGRRKGGVLHLRHLPLQLAEGRLSPWVEMAAPKKQEETPTSHLIINIGRNYSSVY